MLYQLSLPDWQYFFNFVLSAILRCLRFSWSILPIIRHCTHLGCSNMSACIMNTKYKQGSTLTGVRDSSNLAWTTPFCEEAVHQTPKFKCSVYQNGCLILPEQRTNILGKTVKLATVIPRQKKRNEVQHMHKIRVNRQICDWLCQHVGRQ